jgi:hypothetical protein
VTGAPSYAEAAAICDAAPGTTCGNHRAHFPRHLRTSPGMVLAVQAHEPTPEPGRNPETSDSQIAVRAQPLLAIPGRRGQVTILSRRQPSRPGQHARAADARASPPPRARTASSAVRSCSIRTSIATVLLMAARPPVQEHSGTLRSPGCRNPSSPTPQIGHHTTPCWPSPARRTCPAPTRRLRVRPRSAEGGRRRGPRYQQRAQRPTWPGLPTHPC